MTQMIILIKLVTPMFQNLFSLLKDNTETSLEIDPNTLLDYEPDEAKQDTTETDEGDQLISIEPSENEG